MPGSTVLKSLDVLLGVIPNLTQNTIGNINQPPASIDIYVLQDCPWSTRALHLLDSYNIKYNYYLITNDEDFKKISDITSFNTFPQIFIKNVFIGGYSELADLSKSGNLVEIIG